MLTYVRGCCAFESACALPSGVIRDFETTSIYSGRHRIAPSRVGVCASSRDDIEADLFGAVGAVDHNGLDVARLAGARDEGHVTGQPLLPETFLPLEQREQFLHVGDELVQRDDGHMDGRQERHRPGLAGAVAQDDRRGVGQAEVGRGDADVGGDDLSALILPLLAAAFGVVGAGDRRRDEYGNPEISQRLGQVQAFDQGMPPDGDLLDVAPFRASGLNQLRDTRRNGGLVRQGLDMQVDRLGRSRQPIEEFFPLRRRAAAHPLAKRQGRSRRRLGEQALAAAIANYQGQTLPKTQEGEVICECFGVTDKEIERVIRENGLKTREEVTNYTKAGGGCESCHDKIEALLARVLKEERAARPAPAPPRPALTNIRKMKLIEDTLEREIKPALKADGGDIDLIDIDGNKVLVALRGACSSCRAAEVTLKDYVELKLKEFVTPEITVEEVKP